MLKKEKRGVSQVVTQTIMIVIVISAIVIIAGTVIKITREKAEEIDIEVMTVDANIEKSSIYINKTEGKLQFSLSRGSDNAELSSMKIVIVDSGGNEIYELSEESGFIFPTPLETKTYVLDIRGLENISKILVFPVSEKGNPGILKEYDISNEEPQTINPLIPVVERSSGGGGSSGGGSSGGGSSSPTSTVIDSDNDGFNSEIDCEDSNPSIYPYALEICSDNIDNDCDGEIDEGCICVDKELLNSCNDYDGNTLVVDKLDCGNIDCNYNLCSDEQCENIIASLPGDVNGDDYVSSLDLTIITTNWGISPATKQQGDLNGDGTVSSLDQTIVTNHFGEFAYIDCYSSCNGINNLDSCINPINSRACSWEQSCIPSTEICDDIDNNCNGEIDEVCDETPTIYTFYKDSDNDGYGNLTNTAQGESLPEGYIDNFYDCNDNNALINPGVGDIPYNNLDEDCDGFDLIDVDRDGYNAEIVGGNDCNDNNIDLWQYLQGYIDTDQDSYGIGELINVCSGDTLRSGYSNRLLDCDDSNQDTYPDAVELCDNKDNDCDGTADTDCQGWCDTDQDGHYSPWCFWLSNSDDCNDNNPITYPEAIELCDNNRDNDCDGTVDENCCNTGSGLCTGDETCDSCLQDCGECISKPYYEETAIYNDIYNNPWFSYIPVEGDRYYGQTFLVSPMIDVGSGNEMLHHKVTVDYTSTNGNGDVKVSIGHSGLTDFFDVINTSGRHTYFTNINSREEIQISSQYRGERYSWIILELPEDTIVNNVNHTYWIGFDTLYGHEAKEFSFSGGTLRYRMLYPKNYKSNKRYPLVISNHGSGGMGNNNYKQMEMVVFGRYIFQNYYHNEEFEAISIVPQVWKYDTSTSPASHPVPAPYWPNVSCGDGTEMCLLGEPEYLYHSSYGYVNENGFFAEALHALVDEMIADSDLSIDANRIYLTGFSLGGKTTYEMMKEMNEILAAGWSVDGWAIGSHTTDYRSRPDDDPMIIRLKQEVARYKHIPLQVSSGNGTATEPEYFKYGGELVCNEVNAQGGSCTHTIFPNCGHICTQGRAYGNIDYVNWLFNQNR